MTLPVSISLDLLLISLGLIWGICWALFIQHVRAGQFLVERRTWITVVVGVGVDLIIGFNQDWFNITVIVIASSVGIIVRSLWNERKEDINPNSYKLKWNLEDAIGLSSDLTQVVTVLLERSKELGADELQQLAKILSLTNRINEKIRNARKGEY